VDGRLISKALSAATTRPKNLIYSVDTTKKHEIGTRLEVDDRVFRYAYAGSDLLAGWGCQAYNSFSNSTNVEDQTIGAAGTAGDTTITCTAVGTVTADMFKDGYALIRWELHQYRIISNTAAAALSTFTVTLDEPLWEGVDAASVVTLYRNPWADTRRLTGGDEALWASTVGIPPMDVSSGEYYWAQTWGPCLGIGVDNIGATASERGLYFLASGALFTMVGPHATNNQPANQPAGFLLPYTGPGPTGSDQPGAVIHFYLQIAP